MASFLKKRKKNSNIAKERLKLVLLHDRTGTSPNSQIMKMIKKDVIKAVSSYVEVDEQQFELNISNIQKNDNTFTSQLVISIPVKGIRNLGRNSY